MIPGERFDRKDPRTDDKGDCFHVIATEPSRSCPGATNYRLARVVDGRAVRAEALANGTIRRPGPKTPPAALASDYWGFRHAAEDIFIEFDEGCATGQGEYDNAIALDTIANRRSTNIVVASRLNELLYGGAEDWDIAKQKRFDEPKEMRNEFCAQNQGAADEDVWHIDGVRYAEGVAA